MENHGVSNVRLPLYLNVLDFHYIHRAADLFLRIVNNLCDPVPLILNMLI